MNASKVSTVKDKFAGLFNPIGKVLLIFYKIRLNWTEQKNLGTIFLRIRTSGFEYESKKMLAVS